MMNLIPEIINELVNANGTLQGPFLKTKVLASKLKNIELLTWVNSELNGYPDVETLPEYRIYEPFIVCSWANGNRLTGITQGQNMHLPIRGYGKQFDKYFSTFTFTDSISTLESFVSKEEGRYYQRRCQWIFVEF